MAKTSLSISNQSFHFPNQKQIIIRRNLSLTLVDFQLINTVLFLEKKEDKRRKKYQRHVITYIIE